MALGKTTCSALLAVGLCLSAAPLAAQSTATSPALSSAVSVPPPEDPLPEGVPQPDDGAGSAPGASPAVPSPPGAAPQGPQAAALPAGSGTLDSATLQRIVDRLVSLHFLANPGEGQDADSLAQAIRDFQSSAGISPTGMLDRDTVGRLTTP